MADTHRERSALVALLADNTAGDISAQDIRDWLLSTLLRNVTTYSSSTPTIDDDDVVVLLDGTSNTVAAALPAAASSANRILLVKAINIDNAVALDPGSDNLEGTTTDYTFATANDAIIIACDGTAWHILAEFLNA